MAGRDASAIDGLQESGEDAFAMLEAGRGITGWSRALERLSGVGRSAALGGALAAIHPELADALGLSGPLDRGLEGLEGVRSGIAPLFGRPAVGWSLRPFGREVGPIGAICVLRERGASDDLSERVVETERRLRDFVEAASDWFWEMDSELRYSYLSDRYYEATGVVPGSRLGKRRGEFRMLGHNDGDWEAHLADLTARRPFRDFSFAYLDTEGRRRVARVSGQPVFGADRSFKGYRGVGRDITDLVRAEARIRHLAQHDPLTDLPNRALFQERLGEAIAGARRRGRRIALLCVDLDDFKGVNDALGHAAGDRLLQEIAGRMRQTLRETDTVARLGGDEFAVIQVDLVAADAAAVLAERLVAGIAAPVTLAEETVAASASIGVAVFPEDGEDADTLLRHADLALYRAKALGRNGFQLYRPEHGREHSLRRRLEAELRRALDGDELELDFAPAMDLATGRLVGLEAVPRWDSPELGTVPPETFVQVAERCGLMETLGRWVLQRACAGARQWRLAGLPAIKVGVNLSAAQLARTDVVAELESTLRATGLEPDAIELEVAEDVLTGGTPEALEALLRFHALGVALTVDGFGAGACSLARLGRLPLRRLKIDRSVVGGLGEAEGDAAVARAMIALGHQLGLRVLADGVQRPAQLQLLREFGCDEAQGPAVTASMGDWPRTLAVAMDHQRLAVEPRAA